MLLRELGGRRGDPVQLLEDRGPARRGRRASLRCRARPGSSRPSGRRRDASRSALASGTTGVAELTAARPSSATSKRAGSHAATTASAASCGIAPARASATRQRRLEAQHRGQVRLVGQRLAQRVRHEHRAEQRQTSKNTVSPSPCRRMSKRSTPPSSRAISVSRAAASSIDAQHRVGRVGLRLVGEVDPRRQLAQQPAGEHVDRDVRRLHRPVGPGHAPGLHRREPVAPLGVGRRSGRSRRSPPRARASSRSSLGWA